MKKIKIFPLLVFLYFTISCEKENIFPDFFIAATCLDNQIDCIEFQGQKLAENTIINIKIQNAAVYEEGVQVNFKPETQDLLKHVYRDYFDKEIIHVFKNNIIHKHLIKSVIPEVSFKYQHSKDRHENINFCLKIHTQCNVEALKNIENFKMSKDHKISTLIERNKKFPTIYESFEWITNQTSLFIYDQKGINKLKTINPQTLALRQEFDVKSGKFIHTDKMIKLEIGWAKKSEIIPENLYTDLAETASTLMKFIYQKKCIDIEMIKSQNSSDPQLAIDLLNKHFDMQIRSLIVAHNILSTQNKIDLKELEKNIQKLECK